MSATGSTSAAPQHAADRESFCTRRHATERPLNNDNGSAATGHSEVHVICYCDGRLEHVTDPIVEEIPVALVFNGISHTVMLATALDLYDFALGFSLSEGLVSSRSDIYGIDVIRRDAGIEVHLEISGACEHRLKARRRTLAGRTGCGLCGTESLEQVIRPMPIARQTLRVTPAAVATSIDSMHSMQTLQRLTGSSHAAAWCDLDGCAKLVREDVGRHNALDKLIGALAASGVAACEGFFAVTSRASVEMVQKTLTSGVEVLVAVSAPTSMAVALASGCGLGLAGFVRRDRFVCYASPAHFGFDV